MKASKPLVLLSLAALCLALSAQGLVAGEEMEWTVLVSHVEDLDNTEVKNTLLSAGVDGQEDVNYIEWSDYPNIYICVRVTTENNVLGSLTVGFSPENRELYLEVWYTSGNSGEFYVFAPKSLVPDPENIEVYIDNEPLSRTVTERETYYMIRSDFTFSEHTIAVKLSPPSVPPGGDAQPPGGDAQPQAKPPGGDAQPIYLALTAVAIVAALGAVYWLKLRR